MLTDFANRDPSNDELDALGSFFDKALANWQLRANKPEFQAAWSTSELDWTAPTSVLLLQAHADSTTSWIETQEALPRYGELKPFTEEKKYELTSNYALLKEAFTVFARWKPLLEHPRDVNSVVRIALRRLQDGEQERAARAPRYEDGSREHFQCLVDVRSPLELLLQDTFVSLCDASGPLVWKIVGSKFNEILHDMKNAVWNLQRDGTLSEESTPLRVYEALMPEAVRMFFFYSTLSTRASAEWKDNKARFFEDRAVKHSFFVSCLLNAINPAVVFPWHGSLAALLRAAGVPMELMRALNSIGAIASPESARVMSKKGAAIAKKRVVKMAQEALNSVQPHVNVIPVFVFDNLDFDKRRRAFYAGKKAGGVHITTSQIYFLNDERASERMDCAAPARKIEREELVLADVLDTSPRWSEKVAKELNDKQQAFLRDIQSLDQQCAEMQAQCAREATALKDYKQAKLQEMRKTNKELMTEVLRW